jgi:hypothetical protein
LAIDRECLTKSIGGERSGLDLGSSHDDERESAGFAFVKLWGLGKNIAVSCCWIKTYETDQSGVVGTDPAELQKILRIASCCPVGSYSVLSKKSICTVHVYPPHSYVLCALLRSQYQLGPN